MAFPINLTSGIVYLRNLLAGGGTGTYIPSGVVSAQFTPVSNAGTGATDLMTYALPGSSLNVNGRGVRITAWGTFAANANVKTVALLFGGTTLHSRAVATSGGMWIITAVVLRVTATTQIAEAELRESSSTTNTVYSGENTTPAETLSGAVTIKVVGTSAVGSNDVTQTGLLIEVLP